MLTLKDFDVFFFDFDGLLVNSEHLHFMAYKKMLAKRECELSCDYLTYAGIAHISSDGLKKSILQTFPSLQSEEWDQLYEEKKSIYFDLLQSGELSLMAGADELLKILQEMHKRHCVVTNSTRKQIELIKERLPTLQSIPLWVTREEYENPKPAPDSYLKAIALYAQKGDRMIGFEDSMRGITALMRTQIKPILICSPNHPQMSVIDQKRIVFFPSLEEFLKSANSH